MKYSLRSFARAHWLALAAAIGLAGCQQDGSSPAGPSTLIDSPASAVGSSLPAPTTANETIFWNAPTENTDGAALTNLSGFKIYYGTASKQYTNTITVSNPGLLTYVIDALTIGTTYYFAVTAVSSAGVESAYSPEVSATIA